MTRPPCLCAPGICRDGCLGCALRDPQLPCLADRGVADEVCPNGCHRYGTWWVPEDCPIHLGVSS